MRILSGLCIASLFVVGLSAQNRFGNIRNTPTGVPNAVFPPVKPIINAGVQRNITVNRGFGFFGNGVGVGTGFGFGNGFGRRTNVVPFAYPVYVGGYGYGGFGGPYDTPYAAGYAPTDPSVQQQAPPNVMVVYPPPPAPVIVNQSSPNGAPQGPSAMQAPNTMQNGGGVITQVAPPEAAAAADQGEQGPPHYLIAFKDHSVYSAIAYWIDGDTIHYFTSGNTHNQASVSLVDRELTERLNRESGLELTLPPVKPAQ